jgi:hypothetical protein
MRGQPDQRIRQQPKRPTGTACRGLEHAVAVCRGTDEQLNRMAGVVVLQKPLRLSRVNISRLSTPTRAAPRPTAETDMHEYFRVRPPSVHRMVLTPERAGFSRRQPRIPRTLILNTCQSYFDILAFP